MDATPNSKSAPEWLTVREFAAHFRISQKTVTRWAESGQLRMERLGRTGRIIRIHSSELNRESSPASA